MKKILLSAALLASTMAIAEDYKYEITPVIGYNIAEGNLNLDNQFLVGAEFQLNTDTFLKPELSILFTDTDYEDLPVNPSTDIWRFAFNGVHDFNTIGAFTPLMKVGVGYESLQNNLADNDDALFLNAGVGVKTPLTEAIALKLEAIYMNKEFDSNFPDSFFYMQITDIKGIGAKTAKSLYEAGFKTIEELKKASAADILSIKGIGKSALTKIEEH